MRCCQRTTGTWEHGLLDLRALRKHYKNQCHRFLEEKVNYALAWNYSTRDKGSGWRKRAGVERRSWWYDESNKQLGNVWGTQVKIHNEDKHRARKVLWGKQNHKTLVLEMSEISSKNQICGSARFGTPRSDT